MGASKLSKGREAFWRAHHESWLNSGLTQKAYCEQEGLKRSSFGAWRTRINERLRNDVKDSTGFVAIKTTRLNSERPSSGILILLPNGVRLGIGYDIEKELLRDLFSLAGKL